MLKFLITFIAGSLIGYLASFLLNTESGLTTRTLVPGTPDSSLVKGSIQEKIEDKTFEGHAVIHHAASLPLGETERGSSSFEKILPLDSLLSPMSFVSLTIKTYPPADSIHLSYFANIKERTFEKTDTLFITRTDTLTMKEVIEQPRAFYDNFWAGAAVVALLFALISGVL